MCRLAVAILFAGIFGVSPAHSAEEFGIYEGILRSSVSFPETIAAVEDAIAESDLSLHGAHVVRVPDGVQQAKIYVLTSPHYAAAAASEPARTISAQILRVAVYTSGEDRRTFVNMANPASHAMVYYSQSENYAALLDAARHAAGQIRWLVSDIPGEPTSIQSEPRRTEKHYRKFKGDGPARMMAKFRKWKKSQREIEMDPQSSFESVVEIVAAALKSSSVADASRSQGWEQVSRVKLRDDVVYFGLTNPYIEDKMIRINSRFRSDGKSESAPFPGVDHVAALPTEVIVVNDGGKFLVLHYGQMWRMQLYFWDSGYRAFTANVGVPGTIFKSIEAAIQNSRP